MERNYVKLLLLLFFIFFQCASSTQKESENTADTTAVVSAPPEEVSVSDQTTDDSEYVASFDMDDFTKHPFESDYPYIKKYLKEDSIIFTIIANDTTHSEYRTILFDSSRIEFLDSDPRFQDELGDLICSSDIRSPKFQFNQGITIGMPQDEFLTLANLTESSLVKGAATSHRYYENSIPFDDEGHWKITLWFNAGFLVCIQSEISPCFFYYGD